MKSYLTLWLIGVAMVLIWGGSSPADAMTAYSRIYKMECSQCHTKNVPELNDFGIEFYKNRLVIPGKEKNDKSPDAQGTAAGGATAKPASGAEEKAPPKPATTGDKDGGETAAEEEQKPVVEPPPTVVYRVKSADGSVFFTDNPLRKGGEPSGSGKGAGKPIARKGKKVVAQQEVKPKEQVQPAAEPRGTGRPVAPAPVERYRSYEECMERVMVGTPSPASAQEMMDLITGAEKKCAAFPSEKR